MPSKPTLISFARLDLAHELRTDDIEGDALAGEDGGIAHPAHHQRTDAERVAAGDHPLWSHDDQRISAFKQTQGIDQPVDRWSDNGWSRRGG